MECRSSLVVLAAYVLVLLVSLHTLHGAEHTHQFNYLVSLHIIIMRLYTAMRCLAVEYMLVCFLVAYSFYMHTESDSNYYHNYLLAYLCLTYIFLSLYLSENILCETMKKERFRKRNHDNRSL